MKRIEKIYSYIEGKSKEYTKSSDLREKGIDALEISEELKILRNNVSKELNVLCRMGKLIKVKTRPVKYFDKEKLETLLEIKIKNDMSIEELEKSIKYMISDAEKCPFDYLIGFKTSLKNQIEQAKAAIMYPSNGLHTLLLGTTGAGKSLFGNIMYEYGKYINKFNEDALFMRFNCADNNNNPQLLLAQLFGYIKGTFMEENSEGKGIIEEADGGVLFLDEIHKLPAEAQERIFYFIDTGRFNRLGENEYKRRANVLIIGATIEERDSMLLKKIVKRIPIMISIPNFEERTIKDRIDIMKELLQCEAVKINKPIKITRKIIKALMGSIEFGNIGQLKLNIQLLCAKAFLNSINGKKDININLDILPNNIKVELIHVENKKIENEEIIELVAKEIIIYPHEKEFKVIEDNYEPPFNLYKIIEDKFIVLKNEGMSEEDISKFINTDINVHIKCFYESLKSKKFSKEQLSRIVNEKIIDFAEEIRIYLSKELKKEYGQKFLYALSLHLSSLFTRLNQHNEIDENYFEIAEKVLISPREYEISKYISDMVEKRFNVRVPENESAYIMSLITLIEEKNNNDKVGIVVVAHGSSTASSMVNVAVKLFGNKNILAIDMPLDINPKETLKIVCKKIKEIDTGKGVLLLIDMGVLNEFTNIIYNKTGIRIKSVDMTSTPTVLEAARKTSLDDLSLDEVYNYIKCFKGYNDGVNKQEINKTIITVCSTGKGTAIKLKELVENIIKNKTSEDISVINLGIENIKEEINRLTKNNNIIAIIGSINPDIDIPFISLEKFICGNGEKILNNILIGENIIIDTEKNTMVIEKLCYDTLKETITYFNPDKIIGLLLEFMDDLERESQKEFSNSNKLRIMLHVACALERVVLKDELEYCEKKEKLDKKNIKNVKKSMEIFERVLNLKISNDEIYYIVDSLSY
ncbi:sigma 54-interacting transcriptional regulator [uncultured Clostridium sp.]|uniref:sigma 54-interacting transcriptional regulator n=1 Tax=uncultured Clostridium sp. TaxID=59620 RepID=UPI00262E03D7|nr:sigma 54-interacting transcriptional regulator [uncultured Clostridium sp.]